MSLKSLTPLEIKKTLPVYIADLFFSLHYAAILYVNSSLLEQYFSVRITSILFILGAIGNILLFYKAPHLLKRFGNRALFFVLVLLDAFATCGLAVSSSPHLIALFFVIFESVGIMIYFCLDIFLEDASLDANTGTIRGIDLTVANTAVAVGPLLIAYFAISGNFSRLYGFSALLLLPLLYQAFFSFKLFRDGEAESYEGETASASELWWKNKDIRRITLARFILEFFYAFMVIYVPVYLHESVGFDWVQIGTMFAIMLVPFILLQFPAGEAADVWLGEKELLITGFFFTGASVLFMPFIGKSFLLWTIALFVSRIGAALAEVMSDTYFFKSVNKRDTGLITIFRVSRPVGIVAGALWGILVLFYTSYAGMFFTLGVISLVGILVSLNIRDTL